MSERAHRLIPAVWVILTDADERIFLLRRANTGWQDGTFTVPAGHIEYMESPRQAAIRELKEEAGVDADANDLEFAHVTFYKSNDGTETERVSVFFTLRTYTGEAHLVETDKASEAGWFEPDAIPELAVTLDHGISCIKQGLTYSELYY